MKFIWIVLLSLLSTVSMARENELGLGISLGNPTGLNGKYWLSSEHAVDGGFAMSLGKNTDVSMHSDYLLHKENSFYFNDVHPLDLYYGLGARMEFADDIELGVRLPIGLVHNVAEKPADMFIEAAPIVDFLGRTGLELHLLVGARYYFK